MGDSLEHDVNGAAAYGIDVVFVCGGIHAEELGYEADTLVAQKVGDGKHVPAVDAAAVEKLADDSDSLDRPPPRLDIQVVTRGEGGYRGGWVSALDVCRVSCRYLTLSVMDATFARLARVGRRSRVVAANLVA